MWQITGQEADKCTHGAVRNSQVVKEELREKQLNYRERWGSVLGLIWDSARPTVLGNPKSLQPIQGWDHLEIVSTIPKFKFNIQHLQKLKMEKRIHREIINPWTFFPVAFCLVNSLISSHFSVWRYLGTRRYLLRIKIPVQHNPLHNPTLGLTLFQLG